MMARIAYVTGRAPVFGSNGQGDEADDLGCKRLGIWRRAVDEQFHDTGDQSDQKARHVFIRLEPAAHMIFDRHQAPAKLAGGDTRPKTRPTPRPKVLKYELA